MKILIVGAGPVGCSAALQLDKSGHEIKVVEKFPEYRAKSNGKSINITISEKGLQALKTACHGIEKLVEQEGVKVTGRIVHDRQGKQYPPTQYGRAEQGIISFQRNHINDILITEVKNSKSIDLYFDHELVCMDPNNARCIFRTPKSDTPVEMKADLIIGTDGAQSVVRSGIQRNNALCFLEQKKHKHAYIELSIPAHKKLNPGYLHMWPRGEFLMLALPNKDGSFSGNLFMPWHAWDNIMKSPKSLLAFCKANFKDLLDIIGEAALLADIQPGPGFRPNCLTSIKCEPYHYKDKVVLLGDAAHAVVPFYGQGMNAGLQDSVVLAEILKKYGQEKATLGQALQEFSNVQCPNGHAIAKLSFDHYVQLRSGIAGKSFYVRQVTDRFINSLFPTHWPIEYDMVAFSTTPYSLCLREKERQHRLLQGFMFGGAALVAMLALCWFVLTVLCS